MVECEDAGFKAGKVFTTPLIIFLGLPEIHPDWFLSPVYISHLFLYLISQEFSLTAFASYQAVKRLKVRLSNFGWLPVHFHSIYQLIFLNPTSILCFEPDLSRCESSKNALILPLIAFPIGFSVFLIPANQSVIVPTCHEIISEIRTLEISDLLPPKGINFDGGYNIVYFSLRI